MGHELSKPYRLIWFQHFHKAAGTSITNLAMANGEAFYARHNNGNPVGADGKELELWTYSAAELSRFVDDCERAGVTFVATEWGTPDLNALAQDPRVRLITCLRHPLSRFVSNFYFDLYHGFTPARSLRDYVGSRNRTITMPDYYCRMLTRIYNNPAALGEEDFPRAKEALGKFHSVSVLENGLAELGNVLGWGTNRVHANKSAFSFRQFLGLLRRGRLDLIYLRARYPRKRPADDFIEFFKAAGKCDFDLYEYAATRTAS